MPRELTRPNILRKHKRKWTLLCTRRCTKIGENSSRLQSLVRPEKANALSIFATVDDAPPLIDNACADRYLRVESYRLTEMRSGPSTDKLMVELVGAERSLLALLSTGNTPLDVSTVSIVEEVWTRVNFALRAELRQSSSPIALRYIEIRYHW